MSTAGPTVADPSIDRWAPRQRPAQPPAGSQSWRELLFLHWEVDPQVIRPLVPDPLQLDLVGGRALVGLVPFQMANVRSVRWPWRLTADFGETNVRTYVVHRGRPGVYFLSLDAASLLATLGARIGWGLPYFWSDIDSRRTAVGWSYRLQRRFSSARMDVAYEFISGGRDTSPVVTPMELGSGVAAARSDGVPHGVKGLHSVEVSGGQGVAQGNAVSGGVGAGGDVNGAEGVDLADFLLERYLLFVVRGGRVWEGQVHHRAYPVEPVRLLSIDQTLVSAAGIRMDRCWPDHVHWSPGVDVEIFPLQRVS